MSTTCAYLLTQFPWKQGGGEAMLRQDRLLFQIGATNYRCAHGSRDSRLHACSRCRLKTAGWR
jgi:hypothetical protein